MKSTMERIGDTIRKACIKILIIINATKKNVSEKPTNLKHFSNLYTMQKLRPNEVEEYATVNSTHKILWKNFKGFLKLRLSFEQIQRKLYASHWIQKNYRMFFWDLNYLFCVSSVPFTLFNWYRILLNYLLL